MFQRLPSQSIHQQSLTKDPATRQLTVTRLFVILIKVPVVFGGSLLLERTPLASVPSILGTLSVPGTPRRLTDGCSWVISAYPSTGPVGYYWLMDFAGTLLFSDFDFDRKIDRARRGYVYGLVVRAEVSTVGAPKSWSPESGMTRRTIENVSIGCEKYGGFCYQFLAKISNFSFCTLCLIMQVTKSVNLCFPVEKDAYKQCHANMHASA